MGRRGSIAKLALRANREQPRRVTSFYTREGPNLSSLETSPLNARGLGVP